MHAIYKETVLKLTPEYGEQEANALASILFEDLLGIDKIQRLTDLNKTLPSVDYQLIADSTSRLLKHEPVQQIVGYTEFLGRKFHVTKDTLIPRPETEELVELVIRGNRKASPKILDVGTGSGCIAISLQLGIMNSLVTGIDISSDALEVARKNASTLFSTARFELLDIIKNSPKGTFDIIVSNPPYIPESDKLDMSPNVLKYEPEVALFVPDSDALLFYRRIAELAKESLTPEGMLYFEIHESFGYETKEVLEKIGYQNITIIQDLNGKDRMVKAFK